MILTFTFVTSLWNRSACYRMPLGLPKTEKPPGRVPTSPSSLPLITDLFSPVPRHLLLLCFYMSAYAFMTWLAKMDGQACKCPPTSCFYRMKRKVRQRSFLGRTSANGQEPCEQVPTDERQESEAGTRPDASGPSPGPGTSSGEGSCLSGQLAVVEVISVTFLKRWQYIIQAPTKRQIFDKALKVHVQNNEKRKPNRSQLFMCLQYRPVACKIKTKI